MSKSIQEIQNQIGVYSNWYHQIELAPGIVTPGINDSATELAILDRLGLPDNATGLRVLDIGCRDGFFAFEMERRGAEVLGIDYAAPDITGFSIASEILGSGVTYDVENVYDLTPERHGTFDIVLFLGVLYHLRNPLQAFDGIREVVKDGGLLFVETQMVTDPDLARSSTPAWQFYPGDSLNGDDSNKWAPNMAGLEAMVGECQFEILETLSGDRGYITGRAIQDKRKGFFRTLDSSRDLYGKAHWKE